MHRPKKTATTVATVAKTSETKNVFDCVLAH